MIFFFKEYYDIELLNAKLKGGERNKPMRPTRTVK